MSKDLKENNGWISVKERLPEDGIFYLTCYKSDDYYSCQSAQIYNQNNGRKIFIDRYGTPINPTHWQPLPKPPNTTQS